MNLNIILLYGISIIFAIPLNKYKKHQYFSSCELVNETEYKQFLDYVSYKQEYIKQKDEDIKQQSNKEQEEKLIVVNTNINTSTNTYATFYFRIGGDQNGCPSVQNFDGHYGSCGHQYNSNSKYWVAIANGNNYCGRDIKVSYGSSEMTLKVMDTCPGCTDGHIDMGLDALVELTGSVGAACAIDRELPKIEWEFI